MISNAINAAERIFVVYSIDKVAVKILLYNLLMVLLIDIKKIKKIVNEPIKSLKSKYSL